MYENNTDSNYTPMEQPEKPKSNTKKLVVIVAIVILSLVIGSLTYLYIKEINSNKELTKKISQVESQQPTKQVETSKNEEVAMEGGKISYVAEVGAFSLNLPNNYRIVEYIDGAGEGGKATEIDIAINSKKGAATIDNFAYNKVSILATPVQNYGDFDLFIKAKVPDGSDYTKKASIKIAGVDAQVYDVPGLDLTTYYFFEKDGIHYVITNGSSDKSKITDVINGFSFVY